MTQPNSKWLLYGANGYTGRLIARHAIAAGHTPILAGRNQPQIEALAAELDCPFRVFDLKHSAVVADDLSDVSLVLNCAGPFQETAGPMIEACLMTGTHYLDITGEWKVIEAASGWDRQAKNAGIVIMPAVGFDVVPSDCLALKLAEALPTANQLELAFQVSTRESSISPGTATTIFSQLGQGTFARVDGKIQRLPSPWVTTKIFFSSGERSAVSISWGDIASAFHSTGIPNIRVYQAMSERQAAKMRRWSWLLPLAGLAPIQWLGRRWIKRNIPGPTDQQRAQSQAEFWGKVTDPSGQTAEAILRTPEGYTLTTLTAVEIVQQVLASNIPPGFSTPAKALGAEFIESISGVEFVWRKQLD